MSAYNNYQTYPTYNYGQRNYGTSYMPQPIVPTQPIQQQPADFPIRFANIEEAKGFIVMPNQRQFFINNEKNELYIKSADGLGQSYFDEYILTRKDKQGETAVIEPSKVVDSVTKDDIKDFVSKEYVSGIESQISALNAKVDKFARLGELLTPENSNKESK